MAINLCIHNKMNSEKDLGSVVMAKARARTRGLWRLVGKENAFAIATEQRSLSRSSHVSPTQKTHIYLDYCVSLWLGSLFSYKSSSPISPTRHQIGCFFLPELTLNDITKNSWDTAKTQPRHNQDITITQLRHSQATLQRNTKQYNGTGSNAKQHNAMHTNATQHSNAKQHKVMQSSTKHSKAAQRKAI